MKRAGIPDETQTNDNLLSIVAHVKFGQPAREPTTTITITIERRNRVECFVRNCAVHTNTQTRPESQ